MYKTKTTIHTIQAWLAMNITFGIVFFEFEIFTFILCLCLLIHIRGIRPENEIPKWRPRCAQKQVECGT